MIERVVVSRDVADGKPCIVVSHEDGGSGQRIVLSLDGASALRRALGVALSMK